MVKGESVAQSVIIAQSIISDYPTSCIDGENTVVVSLIISQLEEQLGVVSKIIQNIENYHQAVREKVRSLSERKKLPEDVSNFTFVGKHSHDATLNQMLGFLEFIILNSEEKVSLGTSSIDRLW